MKADIQREIIKKNIITIELNDDELKNLKDGCRDGLGVNDWEGTTMRTFVKKLRNTLGDAIDELEKKQADGRSH